MKSYAFFPGCSLESTARDMAMSTFAVAKALRVRMDELPGWTCCGSTPAHSTDALLATSLPARNLAIAVELGHDLVVCCAACYGRLASANHALSSDDELRSEVADAVGGEHKNAVLSLSKGSVKVLHFLQVLRDEVGLREIRDSVVKSLGGLKVACYYGCLLTRPRELSILSDPEDPQLMEDILAATGAKPIEWPYKTECCGASFSISRTETVKRLSGDILRMAKESGADCIAVACPMCQSNLDLRQEDIERASGEIGLPVFYFTQLLGRALGIADSELGISKLMVDPRKALGKV